MKDIKVKTKTIQQIVHFNAPPEYIYDCLIQSKLHAQFTGEAAHISPIVGGTFTAYGDYISGKNLVLQPGKKIVQQWYCHDLPKNSITEVMFIFRHETVIKNKKKSVGTKLNFTHKNIPSSTDADLASGWKDYYWKPLKEFLKKEEKKAKV